MPNNPQHIELRSEQVQEILSAVPNWMIRWGNTLVLIILLGVLAASWFFKYPDIIATQAIVTSEVPPDREYARTSGAIQEIFVEDNQLVTKNTPLALIENSANYKDVFYLKSIIDTIKPNNRNFSFPIDSIPILFLGDVDSDYALFENSYIQYQLNKQLQPFSSEVSANRISKSELQSRLKILQSQKQLNESELLFQKNDLKRQQSLFEKGVISQQNYEEKQQSFYRAERSFVNMDASISQIREAIGNATRTSVNTSINKTKEDINLLKNVIQSFNQLKRSLKDWEMRYVLASKVDGTVSFLSVWNENQNVTQGDLVFTIIPENNSAFVAKLKSPVLNSGKIKEGQIVNIQLENFPSTEFGSLQGKISTISLLPDEQGFYLINVTLPKKLITNYKKEIPFKYEMLGSAEIITEDLRLIERFFYKLKDVFN